MITLLIICKLGAFGWGAILGGLIFICLWGASKSPQEQEKQSKGQTQTKPRVSISFEGEPQRYISDGFLTKIAGITYRCDTSDIGAFIGMVRPQPDNEHDPNAHAIYRSDGKHLGYVPADDLPDYIRYTNRRDCVCVGYIRKEDDILYGRVKVFKSGADIDRGIASFTRWMVSEFGKRFVPKGMNIEGATTLRTKEDILAALDQYIEDKQPKTTN